MWSSSSSFMMSSSESPLHSIAQYIEDYMDLVENVPNDIARQITQLHEHNHRYHQLLGQLESTLDVANGKTSTSEARRRNALMKIQRCLIEIQEIADDKLLLIQSILDQLDCKARQLDFDYRTVTMSSSSSIAINSRNVTISSVNSATSANNQSAAQKNDANHAAINSNAVGANANIENTHSKETSNNSSVSSHVNNVTSSSSSSQQSGKRASARRNNSSRGNDNGNEVNPGKRSVKRGVKTTSKELKRSKSNSGLMTASPPPLYEGAPIDPDEPTYCLCEQVSFGEMICCDNSACVIEWFHFSCVSLTTKPKGKWFCPNCRGERSNIPKK